MKSEEIKEMLLGAGADKDKLAKIDFAKIEEIVNSSRDIEDLCKKMTEYNPEFDKQLFMDEFNEATKESSKEEESAEDLSDEQLEDVAGGSKAGDWFKKNKDWVVPLAIVGTGLAVRGCFNLYQKNKYKNPLK